MRKNSVVIVTKNNYYCISSKASFTLSDFKKTISITFCKNCLLHTTHMFTLLIIILRMICLVITCIVTLYPD